jgi:hypothetical protein
MNRCVGSIIFFCLVSTIITFGQPRDTGDAKRFTDRMNEGLRLSSEQYRKVLDINLAAAEKTKAALQQTPDSLAVKQKLTAIREEIDISLLEILSAFQWKDWMDLAEELNDRANTQALNNQ